MHRMNDIWVICRHTKNSGVQVLSHIGTQGPIWNIWKRGAASDFGESVSARLFTNHADARTKMALLKSGFPTEVALSITMLSELIALSNDTQQTPQVAVVAN
jgi:hypothetical protein